MLWMGGRPFLFSSFLDGQCFWFSPICLVKAILQMLCRDLLKKKSVGGKEGCVKSLGVARVCYLFGQGNSIFIREF